MRHDPDHLSPTFFYIVLCFTTWTMSMRKSPAAKTRWRTCDEQKLVILLLCWRLKWGFPLLRPPLGALLTEEWSLLCHYYQTVLIFLYYIICNCNKLWATFWIWTIFWYSVSQLFYNPPAYSLHSFWPRCLLPFPYIAIGAQSKQPKWDLKKQ